MGSGLGRLGWGNVRDVADTFKTSWNIVYERCPKGLNKNCHLLGLRVFWEHRGSCYLVEFDLTLGTNDIPRLVGLLLHCEQAKAQQSK